MPFGLLCTKGEKSELVGYGARVDLLDNTSINLIFSRNWTGLQCLQKIAEKIGLSEISYFGLQYGSKKGRERWALLDKPLRHQLEKFAANGLNNTVLSLRVHLYASDINRLQDEITRYFYYLQLRNNILQGRITCDEEFALVLASYCAQAEFGDYFVASSTDYVKDYVLLPSTLITTSTQEELNQKIISLHKKNSGLSAVEAELEYIKLTQKLDGYGDEYFPATEKDGFVILVGASYLGVTVRHPHGLPPVYFKWQDIVRLSHSKNFFNVETSKSLDVIQFEMEDVDTAKYVWKMLVLHHKFRRCNFKTSNSQNLCTSPKKMKLERKVTLPRVTTSEDPDNDNEKQNEKTKEENNCDVSCGLINPVFDEDDNSIQGNLSYKELEDGFAHRNHVDMDSHSNFPIHRTYSGSTTEGSYRPGSLEYLSEPEMKRSSFCSNSSGPSSSRNQSQESLKNIGESGDEERLKLLRSCEKFSSTDSVSFTGVTNPSLERTAEGILSDDKHCSSEVHKVNGDVAPPEASALFTNSVASVELNSQPQRNSRPPSQLTDDSSVVTGRTSGYSTSTDSELEADDEGAVGPLTRESQLEHLEKLVKEGLIFTEYQKMEKTSGLEQLEMVVKDGRILTDYWKIERASEIVNVSTAQRPENRARNRYKDVIPYEETRVHLDPHDNPESNDYINASFLKIRVGRKDYNYIAAQGPMENTACDFWQMVWEQDVRIIVMASETQLSSKNVCYQYWPEDNEKARVQFGRFILETQSVRDASPFTVRKLCLQHSLSGQQRMVYHLQFTAWPDHGVPENPQCFLEFIEELESIRQQVSLVSGISSVLPPTLVHCTAGVGRTGVILMVDILIACLQNNQRLDVAKTLLNLRSQRMLLVANFGQYRFIYATVIHYIRNSRLI